jgi:hypothetical protein
MSPTAFTCVRWRPVSAQVWCRFVERRAGQFELAGRFEADRAVRAASAMTFLALKTGSSRSPVSAISRSRMPPGSS